MEQENTPKMGEGLTELPFDLSILTNRDMHYGFFLVLFLKSGLSQIHWDKMDSDKFGSVIESVLGIALQQSEYNFDLLIKRLQEKKEWAREQAMKSSQNRLESNPVEDTPDIIRAKLDDIRENLRKTLDEQMVIYHQEEKLAEGGVSLTTLKNVSKLMALMAKNLVTSAEFEKNIADIRLKQFEDKATNTTDVPKPD